MTDLQSPDEPIQPSTVQPIWILLIYAKVDATLRATRRNVRSAQLICNMVAKIGILILLTLYRPGALMKGDQVVHFAVVGG
ncbi:hypothetical protein OG417_23665 [Actinoallomurus sp. NBC_01490]|uniref:hypothetical protein n=1 Tax=Actinoallomurus sp. NBC_01490 TaxID=2903557 RepID=UPI002E317B53|nr:hypothetical protein [Actinoallomurus sp. NBC_01490]